MSVHDGVREGRQAWLRVQLSRPAMRLASTISGAYLISWGRGDDDKSLTSWERVLLLETFEPKRRALKSGQRDGRSAEIRWHCLPISWNNWGKRVEFLSAHL